MPVPGYDVFIVDDPLNGADADATDTMYLLSPAGPEEATVFQTPNSGDPTLDAQLSAYFADGAVQGKLVNAKTAVVQGYGSGYELPELEDCFANLPGGPGQIVAPLITDVDELIIVAEKSWEQRKIALLNPPLGMSDTNVAALAADIIAGTDARGAALFADYAQHAVSGGTTVTIPWTITVAAMIAANDLALKNPGLAAAGVQGISLDAVSLSDLRTDARRETLKNAQVNTAKLVGGQYRNYGFRTLADLDELPQWWDLSGSRVVSALCAQAAIIDEQFVFEQIDGSGKLIARYEAQLRAACKALVDIGAIFAYDVDTSAAVNPLSNLQQGLVTATVYLSVSTFAEHIVTNITRRAITASV